MKTQRRTLFALGLLCLFSLPFFSSCDSSDEEEAPVIADPFLEFTVGNSSFEGDFTGFNAAIIALTNPGVSWTSVSMGGSTTTGETISFVVIFDGKSTGTSTLTAEAGEDEDAPQGLSLALVTSSSNAVVYEAANITLNVTSYTPIGGIGAEVEGNFSGTVQDEDGNSTTLSGSFRTGTLSN
ncbi:MAG: hypothetical protein AAF363_17690 [Bacteroidota bacterium]